MGTGFKGTLLSILGILILLLIFYFLCFKGCGERNIVCEYINKTLYFYESKDSSLTICPKLYDEINFSGTQYQWFDSLNHPLTGVTSEPCYNFQSLDSDSVGVYYCVIKNVSRNIHEKQKIVVEMFSVYNSNVEYYPNQLIVQFKTGISDAKKDSIRDNIFHAEVLDQCACDSLQLWRVLDSFIIIGTDTIFIENNPPTTSIRTESLDNLGISIIELNRPVETEQNKSKSGHFKLVDNNEKSKKEPQKRMSGVSPVDGKHLIRVAILDNGMSNPHLKLKEKTWKNPSETNGYPGVDDDGNCVFDDDIGYDFHSQDRNPLPIGYQEDHGTHVAGIIDSVFRLYGALQNSRLEFVNVRVLENSGGDMFDLICGILYCSTVNVDIINMSLGWQGGDTSLILMQAIAGDDTDCVPLIISSAGNDSINNDQIPHFPSGLLLNNIIEVAATRDSINEEMANSNQLFSHYSNYGNSIDIVANGHWMSTVPDQSLNAMKLKDGTSMAAAYISGLAAALLSRRPHYSKIAIKTHLLNQIAITTSNNSGTNNSMKYILDHTLSSKFNNFQVNNNPGPCADAQ